MSPTPWTPAKRTAVKRKIDKEAVRAAARLGAGYVTIIAFFQDGEYVHIQDGGEAPMSSADLYKRLASIETMLDESDGKDISLS